MMSTMMIQMKERIDNENCRRKKMENKNISHEPECLNPVIWRFGTNKIRKSKIANENERTREIKNDANNLINSLNHIDEFE